MHRADPQYPHTDDENIDSTGKNNWANGLLGILPTDFFPMVCLRPSSVLYYIYDIKSLGDSSNDARVAFGGDPMDHRFRMAPIWCSLRHGVAKKIVESRVPFFAKGTYIWYGTVCQDKMVVYQDHMVVYQEMHILHWFSLPHFHPMTSCGWFEALFFVHRELYLPVFGIMIPVGIFDGWIERHEFHIHNIPQRLHKRRPLNNA